MSHNIFIATLLDQDPDNVCTLLLDYIRNDLKIKLYYTFAKRGFESFHLTPLFYKLRFRGEGLGPKTLMSKKKKNHKDQQ